MKLRIGQFAAGAALLLAAALTTGSARAEGSRSLYPATYDASGARADIEVSGSGSKYVGQVARRTFLYVYAETGEYILTGSRNRSNGGDIRIYNPQNFGQPGDETIPGSGNFSCDDGTSQPGKHFAGSGRGTIANRGEELAGPDSADGTVTVPDGFRPCAYQAPTSGIFGVLFTRASSGSGPNGSVSNPAVSDEGVSAWDVTVRATAKATTDLNGRVFTYALVGAMGSGGRKLYTDLYYVTLDGYRYKQTMRGMDPLSFAFFANSSGFLDQGNPLYRDIRGDDQAVSDLPPGITSQPAQLPIFFADIAPGTAADPQASKVLGALGIPSTPPPPEVQAVQFRGNLGVGATTVGAGGNFDFATTNTFSFEIVISRDGVDFSPTRAQNRVLRGVAATGPHTILWDGRDNVSGLFPEGVDYQYRLTGRNGEAHFPFVDVEGNANGGPTIRKLTGAGGTTVFYDDRGYATSLGQPIGIANGLLCGRTPPSPPTPQEGLAGVDSNAVDGSGRYYRHWSGNDSENQDCDDDAAFGDAKGLDLWVYEGTTALQGSLSIFAAPDFTDVGTSIAVPLLAFPNETVFGNVAFRNDGLNAATGVSYSVTFGTAGSRPSSVAFPTLGNSAWSYNAATGVVTFTGLPSSLTLGQQITLPFNYVAPASGVVPAVSTIAAGNESAAQSSPNTANGLTVVIVSDVLTTVAVPPTAAAGSVVNGQVTFENSAIATARARSVTYSLTIGDATLRPAAVTFVKLPPNVSAVYAPGSGSVTFSGLPTSLGLGEVLAVGFEYVAPAAGTIPVNSSIATTTPETTTANNPASGATTFVAVPDLTIAKTHAPASFTQGQVGATFTITVTNLGPGATLRPVVVADTLPDGLNATALSGPGWTCVLIAHRCIRGDVLAPGASYPPITLTVDVAPDAPATMDNVATVSGGGEINTANNTATDPVTVIQIPDLTIAKSHTGAFVAGDTGRTFTIVVTNLGPGPTVGLVTAADTLPAGLTATAIAGTGWACVLATLGCTRNDVLAPGASYPSITLSVDVAPNAPATMNNVATVAGGGETNTTNNTATDPVALTQLADLTIAKSHAGAFTAGDVGKTFTISVTNLGPGPTAGFVTVTDTLPAGLTATALAGSGWTCVLAVLSCTRNDALAPLASFPSITLTVDVSPNAPATMSNVVTVSGGGEINIANNTATDPIAVTLFADLTIAKSHAGAFVAGDVGRTFTISVLNLGPGATAGLVTVTDTLPAGLTATAIAGTGWTCVLATLTCTRSDVLAVAASYPAITVTVNVAPVPPPTMNNVAAVSGGGETNTANNTATDPVSVIPVADLTITKSHAGTFTAGQAGATYTITVTNQGTGATTALVSVTDTLPAGMTATAIAGTGWTCLLATLTCTRGDVLAPAASYPAITLSVNIAPTVSGLLLNVAKVAGGGELNTSNNLALDPANVAPIADLTIAKSHVGAFVAGDAGRAFTIGVTNLGPGATAGLVSVTDTLPAGLVATAIAGTGWSCVLATLTCTRSDVLAPAASYPPLTLTVNVAPLPPPTMNNVATVSGGGEVNTANNTATDLVTVIPVADLTIAKSHAGTFTAGQSGATYTIAVTNQGAGATSGAVTVTDTLPAGLTATAIAGSGWMCVLATLTCTRSDVLAATASYPPITLTVNVAPAATGSLVNQAIVAGGGDANPANNKATDPATIIPGPDLALVKTRSGEFLRGGTGMFTLVVTNVGMGPSTGIVTVTDVLPSGLTTASASGRGWSCTTTPLACTRSNALVPGASYPPITIVVNVASSVAGTYTNTATVSGGGDTNPANNTGSVSGTFPEPPDLVIQKSHTGTLTAGQSATYTIVVRNVSSVAQTQGATVGDILPAGMTATAIAGPGWTCMLATVRCTRADALGPGASFPPITITVNIAASAPDNLTNYAAVFSAGETDLTNNVARDGAAVNPQPPTADLTVAKSHTGNFEQGQIGARYNIAVSNVGAGATTGTVTVADTLPAGLTATALAGPGWTCVVATLTCTRGDVLAAGASYPPITLTVDVSPFAFGSLVNRASVAGGGDANTANNNALDPAFVSSRPTQPIPTLSFAALLFMALVLGFAGRTMLRRAG